MSVKLIEGSVICSLCNSKNK